MQVTNKTVNLWLDLAEYMLRCGAEIYRIEDTLVRVSKAYGAVRTDIFAITSSLVLTVTGEDWQFTSTRRLRHPSSTDLTMLEDLNSLARRICKNPLPDYELARELKSVSAPKQSLIKYICAGALSSGAFTLFFGGSLYDGAVSAVFGIILCLLMRYMSSRGITRLTQYFIGSVFTGVLICLCAELFPVLLPDKIIVGVIMLTIPGIATTNSLRDMLTGDTLSGILRLIQSLLEALVLAGSYTFAVWLTGAEVTYRAASDGLCQILPAIGGALGFSMLLNCRTKYCLFSIPGGGLCWAMYLLSELHFGLNIFWCCFIAALFAAVLSKLSARLFKAPETLFLIPFLIPLIPGSSLFYACCTFVSQQVNSYAMNTVMAVLGIAVGTALATSVFDILFIRKKR